MSVCILQNFENTEFYGPIFQLLVEKQIGFSVSKIGPELAKSTISLALIGKMRLYGTMGLLSVSWYGISGPHYTRGITLKC